MKTLIKKLVRRFLRSPQRSLSANHGWDRSQHQPDWALFARMRWATESNPLHYKQMEGHQIPLHQRRIVRLRENEFTQLRLQQTIDSMSVYGGEIHLPAGRLSLHGSLRLSSHIRICGVPGLTEMVFENSPYGFHIEGSAEHPVHHVSLQHLRVRHIGEHNFSAAIFATHARELDFSDIEILAPKAVGLLLADQVHQSRFSRCRVFASGLAGIMIVRDVSDCVFNDCVAEHCLQSGIFLTDLKLPADIAPTDFIAQLDYTNRIIGNFGPFKGNDPCPCRIDLINCTFRGNRKMGTTTDGVGELRVINCVIAENDCEGITLDNGTWNCLVQQCHIYANGWRGRQDMEELGVDFVEEMGLLEDGSSKAKLPGVSLDNAAYCRVEHNLIEGNWGDGVKFVRAVYACTIASNLISHNNRGNNELFHFFGVLVGVAARQHPEQDDFPSCHNKIQHNDIIGSHYSGVHLLPGTHGNWIDQNRLIGVLHEPIEDHAGFANHLHANTAEMH